MDRRQFLAVLGVTATAGCPGRAADEPTDDGRSPRSGWEQRPETSAPDREASTPDPATATPDQGTSTPVGTVPLARHGDPQTICSESVREDPGIYAVTDPAFGTDWQDIPVAERYRPASTTGGTDDSTIETGSSAGGLAPEQTVVGLAGGGRARAYPVSVLTHHEIVNDDGGPTAGGAPGPVAVTYCPLCNSGLVADRVVDGATLEFLVSGLLWRAPSVPAEAAESTGDVFGAEETGGGTPAVRNSGNLVMYDRGTGSYWSQILARSICGPLAGTELGVVPSEAVTWAQWREEHPDTEVLLPPPHSGIHSPRVGPP